MPLHQYDYLFAVGTIFAFLDAWNIGANDVANSWANSVAARSITYVQAMIGASVMEFTGALGVGGRVAETIRTEIVDTTAFEGNPPLLMLGMVCAVISSSVYLTCATKWGLPVSTTHSILGGVLGMGFGALGSSGVKWIGYKNGQVQLKEGVVQVFLAWIIAPITSGIFAALIFLSAKYAVLVRKNPVMRGLIAVPFYFWLTTSMLIMLLLWKGGSYEVNLTNQQIPGVIVGSGAGMALLVALFLVPWLYRRIIKDDWQIKWYHLFQGPLLLRRGGVPPPPAGYAGPVRNFYEGHLTREQLDEQRAAAAAAENARIRGDVEAAGSTGTKRETDGDRVVESSIASGKNGDMVVENTSAASSARAPTPVEAPNESGKLVGPKPVGVKWYSKAMLWWCLKYAVLRGVDVDVVSSQKETSVLAGDVADIHARARQYDIKTEYLYTFLQIMTAATASFTHGANDVSNAVGPYATIYDIWRRGIIADESPVPDWILAFGGGAIVLGLWTYGYNIMKNLGNRITLQSPARGFSIELGSVISVVVATRLKLPVSTTQCITGATVGVGLCNGDWRAINWRMVAWIYMGWFITVPVTAVVSGCLMAFITHAPHW